MLNFTIMLDQVRKAGRHTRRDPLADPLDAVEWQGLHWALRWMTRRQSAAKPPSPAGRSCEGWQLGARRQVG